MNKSYLPSKKFLKSVGAITILLAIAFIITKITPSIKDKLHRNSIAKNLMIKEVVAEDSNHNGIADWEESLWGLDPKGDGASNKEFILAKKKALDDGNPNNDDAVTENDKLAREFFALIVSLKQTGNLNENSIANLSNGIGKKVVAEQIPDIYTKAIINTTETNTKTIKAYYTNFKKLANRYINSGIGNELTYMGKAVSENDKESIAGLKNIANEYRGFGQDLIQLEVPSSLSDLQLKLANDYEKNAVAIEQMSIMTADPITGMSALVSYKKNNDALAIDLKNLQNFFIRNGILQE